MNPHKAKKVDINSLSPDEQRLFRLYGKLPSRSDHFAKHLKDRKYFDSGDYAMSKAGKGDGVDTGSVGSQHPVPENIPHLTSPANGGNGLLPTHLNHPSMQAGSPVKESSFLNRETSAEEVEGAAADPNKKKQVGDGSGDSHPDNAAGSDTATPTTAPTATPAATAATPAAGGDTAAAAAAPGPAGPNKTGQDAIPIRR